MAYQDVQNSFLSLLNRRDCTTAQAQAFIQGAIVRIQRDLRVPAMEKSAIITVGANWQGLPIPTDMLELIDLIPLESPFDEARIEKCDLTTALRLSSMTGIPEKYCRQGGYWILGPAPATGAQVQIDYYAEFAPLVNPTDTNILITIASDLVQYGALSDACLFWTDKRRGSTIGVSPADGRQMIVDGFEGKYNQILDSLNMMAEGDEENGATAVQSAYAWPDDNQDYPIMNWGA